MDTAERRSDEVVRMERIAMDKKWTKAKKEREAQAGVFSSPNLFQRSRQQPNFWRRQAVQNLMQLLQHKGKIGRSGGSEPTAHGLRAFLLLLPLLLKANALCTRSMLFKSSE